ncbi:MAG: aminoglycoside phosphotransferase family protein [Pseudomonadota bacterium]
MFLSSQDVTDFLIERGLLSAKDVVAGEVTVLEAGRRCRNFKIMTGAGGGFFVKQVRSAAADAIHTLNREAQLFTLIAGRDEFVALRRIVPKFRHYDPTRTALVLDLVPGGENVNELHWRLGRFPPEVGELLGRGLGTYHADTASLKAALESGIFPAQKPWVLGLSPQSLSPLDQFGPGVGPEMIQMLRARPLLLAHLAQLGQGYQFDALVHGDMKWDNFLIFPATPAGAHDFKAIDWELADVGDAAWDIAAIFASYILYVVLSQNHVPPAGDAPREDRQLGAAKPAMRRFWEAYAETRGLTGQLAEFGGLRCMAYLSGRLVLSVFEGLINATLPMAQAEYLMGLAEQIAMQPQKAADDLMGPGALAWNG